MVDMTDPQTFARQVLNDIEMATGEAFDALEPWDYDRLRRAMADIAAHIEGWEKGPRR